jgi:hypothetical protein
MLTDGVLAGPYTSRATHHWSACSLLGLCRAERLRLGARLGVGEPSGGHHGTGAG